MERKALTGNGHRKSATAGAPLWAMTAVAIWVGVVIGAVAFSGLFGRLTGHDALIALMGVSFVVMALTSVSLLRQDLRNITSVSRGQMRRGNR